MKKILKYVGILLLLTLFIGTFVYLYHKAQPEEVVYDVVQVAPQDIVKSSVLTGTIEPREEVKIKPQIAGIIAEVYKEAGDVVKVGDVIAKVKVVPDMSQLSAGESRVRLARLAFAQQGNEFARSKSLYGDRLISREEYERAQLAYNQAKEELNAAQEALQIAREGVSSSNAQLSSTLIRATIDGLILDIPVKVGANVIQSNTFNEGTTVAVIADMSRLMFKGYVDETEVAKVKVGQNLKILIGALQGETFEAVIDFVAPKMAESKPNHYELRATLTPRAGSNIRAGYSANAELVLQAHRQTLALPEGAIVYEDNKPYAYRLTAGEPQSFERVPVTLGLSDGVNIEVKGGLKRGDKVRYLPMKTDTPEQPTTANHP